MGMILLMVLYFLLYNIIIYLHNNVKFKHIYRLFKITFHFSYWKYYNDKGHFKVKQCFLWLALQNLTIYKK